VQGKQNVCLEQARGKDKSTELQSLEKEVKRLRKVESHNVELKASIEALARDKEFLKATVCDIEGNWRRFVGILM
jgi:hypothetical protein